MPSSNKNNPDVVPFNSINESSDKNQLQKLIGIGDRLFLTGFLQGISNGAFNV